MYCYDSLYKLKVGKRIVKLITLFFAIFICTLLWGHGLENEAPKTTKAVRVYPKPPKIDGVLDDEVWKQAPIASVFYQREPEEGIPASEETAFQVAYDDEALYIAIMCYDSEPDKIVRRLYRRDQISYGETDWVGIRLDPHHDHQTGFGFAITPSGSFCDNIILNDSGFDGTWDSVWEVRTAINDLGWSVELKIPYHALRFSPKEEYIWGINLDRSILRKKEYDMWQFVPKNESGISSRNGHLEGIKGIKPPAHLELMPYTVVRETLQAKGETDKDKWQSFSSLGMDVRYGIASNISLNATLNPDFG
ncbi:carbohydrate binding family 9 domain-containing protein, partial [bacterium]|nr:carbohydrate binding family 9 domain-containing protein [bacterium]